MAEGSSQSFRSEDADGILKLEEVKLERTFETDKSGRTSVHVWMTATVSPVDEDYVSITADIDFALFHDDEELGLCRSTGLVFGKENAARAIVADDDLHIPVQADVTRVEVAIDLTKVVHAQGKVRFERTLHETPSS